MLFPRMAAVALGAAVSLGAFAQDEKCPVNPNVRGHENIEWSIGYAFHLTDAKKDLPRVLLVGDSICNGYQGEVQKLLDGRMNVSYWVSSYCATSPGYLRLLGFYLDEAKYDVIHFNNGLHSLETPVDAYAKGVEAALRLIREKQPEARLIWANSTPLASDVLTEKVRARNAAAAAVVARFGCETDDLFGFLDPLDRKANWSDAFHHKASVRTMTAKKVADCVSPAAGAERISGAVKDLLLVAAGGRLRLVRPDGSVAWERADCGDVHHLELHDGWVWYANGGLSRTDVVSGRTECLCRAGGIFAFEVQKGGGFVLAENGSDVVVERTRAGEEIVRFRADASDCVAGGSDRRARKTAAGTYLVCGGGSCVVREYDRTGQLVWSVKAPAPADDCLRCANGNTLVAHGDAVTEFAPDGSVAWRFAAADLPALGLRNLCGLREDRGGNLVIGTSGGSETSALEITRAKKAVWTYRAPGPAGRTAVETERYSHWPVGVAAVSAAEAAQQDALVKAAVLAKPAKARRVLVVTRAFGYCHNDAMSFGDRAIVRGGELTGAWTADVTHDVTRLADAAFLSAYDAIVINNSTSIAAKGYPGMTEALTGFVRNGKGLCLVHSAVDSFYDDPEIADMNGGLFRGHPWMGGGTWSFRNEEPGHPVNAALKGEGNPFARSDEIYQQTGPAYSREKVRVLVSMNLADGPTAKAAKNWKGWLRDDGDFAVSWVRRYGSGRVFYTSFGHDRRAFLDAGRLGHVFAGLQYCLGDLPCDDTPRK